MGSTRILVLGADGFIGRSLTVRLAENKSNQICAFGRFSADKSALIQDFEEHANIAIERGDFLDTKTTEKLIAGSDYVFHLISSTTPASTNGDPYADIKFNVLPSIDLFESCAKNNIKKVIFISSGGTVYGESNEELLYEDSATQPVSPYGIGKLTIENYLAYFKKKAGLNYIVYRVANPYGPQQITKRGQGVIPMFINQLRSNDAITIYGDGKMERDYIHVDDLISMIVQSYDKHNKYAIYNLGSGTGTSINYLVSALEEAAGQRFTNTRHLASPATYMQRCVLSIDRFNQEFGPVKLKTLEDGLREVWQT